MAGVLFLLGFAPTDAGAWGIDFEGLADPGTEADGTARGLIIDDEYATGIAGFNNLNAVISAGSNASQDQKAVLFDTSQDAPFANDTLGSNSPGHILVLQDQSDTSCVSGTYCVDPNDLDSGGYISIDFRDDNGNIPPRVVLESIDFFNIDDQDGAGGTKDKQTGRNEIELYDIYGRQILDDTLYTPSTCATVNSTWGCGNGRWERINYHLFDIARVVIRLKGGGGIDNIQFAVPEPASVALIGVGLVTLIQLRRRRREREAML